MSGIDSDLIRGHIDTIILKSLYHGDKYGLEIIQEVEEKSGGTYELKQPTLYSCLKRLESQGLISSYWEDSDIGGKRHYYKLTEKGIETYKANQEEWLRSRAIIDNLIYNTSIDYAKIYEDRPGEEPTEKQKSDVDELADSNSLDEQKNPEEKQLNLEEEHSSDFLADKEEQEEDEFASYDNSSTAGANFFDSKTEDSNDEEYEEEASEPASPILSDQKNSDDDELVNLNLDDNLEEESLLDESDDKQEEKEEPVSSNYYSSTNLFDEEDEENNQPLDQQNEELNEEPIEENDDDQIYFADNQSDDDQIYKPEPDVDYVNDEEKHEEQEPEQTHSPTYISFGQNQNQDEADITNIEGNEPSEEKEQNNYDYERIEEPDGPSIEETAASINEQFYSQPAQHASAEEINKLYHTTENYENLQAGYTDETYKQMLNELESYGGGNISTTPVKHDVSSAMTFDELKADLEKDGITISKHERQTQESDDTKLYVKTNELNLIKNWIVWGTTSVALLVIFAILNAFKSTYSYNFGFWQFATAIAVSLVIPLYSTTLYLINPYRKSIAKYAPRLSILINLLITVQLIVIVYCINLQIGFYSFSQENYNHLLWIIPLVLTFIPILQSLTYMFLYNSKKFHV